MTQALLRHVESKSLRQKVPIIVAGMTVKVSQKIREGEKERIQNFEGLVLATNGGVGAAGTFTVRKIFDGIGVEKVFPLHGKNIVKIEILKKAKVRRSKLYYMRDLRGKAARMSETHIRSVVHDEEADKKAEAKAKQEEEVVLAKEEVVEEQAESTDKASEPKVEEAVVEADAKQEESKKAVE
ncbi:MAG: 50S ribosomal protein L19 [Candidatus Peribacteraceae bacterium]|nr:50S ribosomal protein L19 [Candidatus Gracilibacteria bacterium]MCF7846356.1 50S ribosomal protein L19 [Candidatus Peribacteraceae bacterium]